MRRHRRPSTGVKSGILLPPECFRLRMTSWDIGSQSSSHTYPIQYLLPQL
jgi:hypothetical protein